ncbi:hypothetical protein [Paraburkholderia sp. SIMBA_054]|uniref:hypothetical protein n=1 Tax=Paraburkholderia sp. SIMBA_054 TaxID=3085795 RepID=UPI00397976B6
MNQKTHEAGDLQPSQQQEADDAHYRALASEVDNWTGGSVSDIPQAALDHFPELLEAESLKRTVPEECRGLVRGKRTEVDVRNSAAYTEYCVRLFAVDEAGHALIRKTKYHAYEDVDDHRFETIPKGEALSLVAQYRRDAATLAEPQQEGNMREGRGFLAGNPSFSYYAFSADGYLIAGFDRSDDATTYVKRDPRLRVLSRAEVAQQFPRQYQEALYERESVEGKVPEAAARQENRQSGRSERAISREMHKRLLARYLGSLTLGDAKQIFEAIECGWREQLNGNMGSQLKADEKKVQAVNVAVEHMLAHDLKYIDDILAEAGFRLDSLQIAANSSAPTLGM